MWRTAGQLATCYTINSIKQVKEKYLSWWSSGTRSQRWVWCHERCYYFRIRYVRVNYQVYQGYYFHCPWRGIKKSQWGVRLSKVDNSSGWKSRPGKVGQPRVVNIGQTEVTPNVKHGGRKAAGLNQWVGVIDFLTRIASKRIIVQCSAYPAHGNS